MGGSEGAMSFLSTAAHLVGRLRGWLDEPVGERGVGEGESAAEPPAAQESGALGLLDDDLLGFDDVGGYRDGGEDFE